MALKRREEVRARKRLSSIEILEGNLRELRSDGAREFVSKAMRLTAKADGTALEVRAAHDAEQSGRIEGFGRIVKEHANAMVFGAMLPGEFGPFAVEYYTVYLHRRIPNQSRKRDGTDADTYRTGHEAYHRLHIAPAVLDKQVHTFGCRIIAKLPEVQLRELNLDPLLKSVEGIFLGAASEKKAWIVFIWRHVLYATISPTRFLSKTSSQLASVKKGVR